MTSPDPSPPTPPTPPVRADARRERVRRWWRRVRIAGITLLLVAFSFRVLLLILLPTVISRAAHYAGVDLSYGRMQLSVIGSTAALWDVKIRTRDGTQHILDADYVYANLSTVELLRLRLFAWRLEAEGVRTDVVREADGTIPLLAALGRAATSPTAPRAASGAAGKGVEFSPPLVVKAVRLHRVAASLRDETVSPAFTSVVRLDLGVSNLGQGDTPADLEVVLASDGVFDIASVTGKATANGSAAGASVSFSLRGVHADRAAPYLAALGLSSDQRNIDVSGSAKVSLQGSAATPGVVSGSANISDLVVRAASEPVATLKSADVDIAALSPSELHLSEVRVTEGVLRAERNPDGSLRFASVSVVQPAPSAAPGTRAAPATRVVTVPSAFHWRVDSFTATACEASLLDRAVSPPNTLAIRLEDLKASGLADQGPPDSTTTFTARMSSPRLASGLRVSGESRPFGAEPVATMTLEAEGVNPEALAPYLQAAGLVSTMTAGEMGCRIRAALTPAKDGARAPRLGVVLDNIIVKEDGKALVEAGPVVVTGLSIDPATSAIDVDSIEGTGPRLTVRRTAEGAVELPGIIWRPRAAAAPAAAAGAPKSAPRTRPSLTVPNVRLGKLAWGGVQLTIQDLATPGSAPIEIADAGAEISGLVLDGRKDAAAATPGAVRAWLRAPGLAERFDVTGTLTPAPGALTAELSVDGRGLDATSLAPYGKAMGIEPTMKQGSLAMHLKAELAQAADGLSAGVAVEDLAFREGDELRAGVKHAGIERIGWVGETLNVGLIRVAGVHIEASRMRDGSMVVAGTRLVPKPPPIEPKPISPFPLIASLGRISLAGATIDDVRVTWRDDAAASPVRIPATIGVVLGPLGVNQEDAPPAPFNVVVSADGLAERLDAEGTLKVTASGVTLVANSSGKGLRAEGVGGYLPSGITPELRNGQFRAKLSVDLRALDGDALSASVRCNDIDYREAGAQEPLAATGEAAIEIERFDPGTGAVHLKRLSAQEVSAAATRRADGALSLLGLAVGVPAAEPAQPPATPSARPTAPTATPAATGARKPLPLMVLDDLDVGVTRVTVVDASRPSSAPVSLVSTRVKTQGPIRLFGEPNETHPTFQVLCQGAIEPVIGQFVVSTSATPVGEHPKVEVTVQSTGMSGEGLAAVLPEITEFVDAAPLRDGRFHTTLSAEADIPWRGDGTIDLSRGLEADVAIGKTAFTMGDEAAALVGVESVSAQRVRFERATGNITIKTMEVNGVSGLAWRDGAGVHVLGVVLKLPRAKGNEDPPAAPATQPVAAVAPASPPAGLEPRTARPEVLIERLTVNGGDFRFEDRALSPPLTIPITSLDADIRGLSSLAMERERPLRFSVSAGAGKVSLPRLKRGSRSGSASDNPDSDLEERDFFSQCTARGAMTLYPQPRGRVIASLNGMELAALRGVAHEAGASLGGGVFDGRVELRSRDDGRLDVKSKLVLTDLKYSEPDNGPVTQSLGISMSLDVAIAAIEAADGSITVPLDLTLDQEGLTTGKMVGAAAGAVGEILVTAVASAPVKVLTGFAGLFSDSKENAHWVEDEPLVLTYAPGVGVLDAASQDRLAAVLRAVRADKKVQVSIEQEFGNADMELESQRANPPADVARALAENLRLRRQSLLTRRGELLASARADSLALSDLTPPPQTATILIYTPGSGPPDRGRKAAELRATNEELAGVEEGLDDLYDLLRPGADRQADRRTRAALLELADVRLGTARRLTDRVAGPAGASRVAIGTPRVVAGDSDDSRLIVRTRRKVK